MQLPSAHERRAVPSISSPTSFYPRRGGIATVTEEMARAAAAGPRSRGLGPRPAGRRHRKGLAFPPAPARRSRAPMIWLCLVAAGARADPPPPTSCVTPRCYLSEPGPMLTLMVLQFLRQPSGRTRLMLTFHGSEILKFHRNPSRGCSAGPARLIRNAARISTLTHYTRDLLCSHFPEAAAKVCPHPGRTAHRISRWRPRPPRTAGRLVILTVGRLHPRKGQLRNPAGPPGPPRPRPRPNRILARRRRDNKATTNASSDGRRRPGGFPRQISRRPPRRPARCAVMPRRTSLP
jgi:phosphatidylinositol alpha-1,6-mannosyltransferase